MANKAEVLVVDDEEQMRLAINAVLERQGYGVSQASNGQEALELLEEKSFDLIISDLKMPVMGGEELMGLVRKRFSRIPIVMITAFGTITQAVEAMKQGAFDFITKPFSAEDLERVVERATSFPAPAKRAGLPRPAASGRAIITHDPVFKRVIEIATTIAPSDASVLIQGESGTGKELIARLIHGASRRAEGPFIAVNCAALPENLLESELFGHEKGAFTGAQGLKLGKFELASGGTILLDEVSEMEPSLQAKLLRVLQEREVDRVGGQKPLPIDVRVIATTNRDLMGAVEKGDFREDLYYRLNVIPLFLPSLKSRKSDIRLLVEHFLRRFAKDERKELASGVMEELEAYAWPGNIRELENSCERAVLLAGQGAISIDHFMLGSSSRSSGGVDDYLKLHPGLSVAEAEKRLIFETLKATDNNKTKAAELLGISIRTLRNKLHEYGDVSA